MRKLEYVIGRIFGNISDFAYRLHFVRLGKNLNAIELWFYAL